MAPVSASAIRNLITGLKEVKANIPQEEALRKELYKVTRDLSFALEDESDSINRIIFTPLQPVAARVGSDLDIFSILIKHDKPMTIAELARATGADPFLLSRFLRYFDSKRIVSHVNLDQFEATNITKALVNPAYQAGLRCCTDSFMRCWQGIPKFLAETKYANPHDMRYTPYQRANNTELSAFVHFPTESPPAMVQDFNLWMSAQFQYAKTWIDVFDMEQQCRNSEATTPIFVDIGGGIGHQCALLKDKLLHQPGRVILQDLPVSIEHALPTAGVENTLFDFWTEQPVKGARVYYLRQILHDYPDVKCIELLHLTMAAMDQNSVILMDEMVLPDVGAHWHAAQIDINMMAHLASMERTAAQWHHLLDAAGLRVKGIYRYSEYIGESVIAAVLR